MDVPEVNSEHQRVWLRWKATAIEWLAVVLSGVAVMLSLVAVIVSMRADVRVDYQDAYIEKLETATSIKSNRLSRLEAYLKAKGVPIEEINDVD